MSALTSRTAAITRRLASTTPTSTLSRAAFTTTTRRQKNPVEAAKDTLKTVDRKVSDTLVDGINIGSAYANKIKEATSEVSEGKVTGRASELRGEAAGKASEVAGEAKGKASEVAGEAKGKASELAGEARGAKEQAKGKASEMAGEAKAKVGEVKEKMS
ncbi:uncharacterized protein B0H64DRAFT_375963 [Chaetomium fimeti]|uniref:LEA domain-containing protein n=1 Tax=Chaetomium fimeti TaxID=1854472 RepID=A0AAE0LPQ8_9PEZI|nr:hypothetical protein B0H64DRAFT_375963 [Chaetomium fimeti]